MTEETVVQGALFFNEPAAHIGPTVSGIAQTMRQLGVVLIVKLERLQRQRCSSCGLRRVVFVLSVEGAPGATLRGLPLCAKDAGIR